MIGTPGRDTSSGGVFYYNPLDTLNDTFIRLVDGRNVTFYSNSNSTVPLDGSLVAQAPTVRASSNVGYLSGPINIPNEWFSYYGNIFAPVSINLFIQAKISTLFLTLFSFHAHCFRLCSC